MAEPAPLPSLPLSSLPPTTATAASALVAASSKKRTRRPPIAPDGVVAPFTLTGLAKLDADAARKVQAILDDHADEDRMDDVVALCLYEEGPWIQFITHLIPDTKLGTQDMVPNTAGSTLFELLWEEVKDRALYERLMGYHVKESSNLPVDHGSPFYLNLHPPTSSSSSWSWYSSSSWWEQWCSVLPKVCPKAATHAFASHGGTTCVVPFRYGQRRYVAVETCSRATYRNYIATHVNGGYHALDNDDNDWTPCDAIITGLSLKGNYDINAEWYMSEAEIATQQSAKEALQRARKQRRDDDSSAVIGATAQQNAQPNSRNTTEITGPITAEDPTSTAIATEEASSTAECTTSNHCEDAAVVEEQTPVWALGDGCELNVSSEGELLFCMRLGQAPNASLHHALRSSNW